MGQLFVSNGSVETSEALVDLIKVDKMVLEKAEIRKTIDKNKQVITFFFILLLFLVHIYLKEHYKESGFKTRQKKTPSEDGSMFACTFQHVQP